MNNNKNLESAKVEFEEHFYEGIRVCTYLTFQKLLEIKGLDYETYYREIANLVVTVNNEDDIKLGVLKIAKKISNEMNLRMQYK